jgi:hypothetical protein
MLYTKNKQCPVRGISEVAQKSLFMLGIQVVAEVTLAYLDIIP